MKTLFATPKYPNIADTREIAKTVDLFCTPKIRNEIIAPRKPMRSVKPILFASCFDTVVPQMQIL